LVKLNIRGDINIQIQLSQKKEYSVLTYYPQKNMFQVLMILIFLHLLNL